MEKGGCLSAFNFCIFALPDFFLFLPFTSTHAKVVPSLPAPRWVRQVVYNTILFLWTPQKHKCHVPPHQLADILRPMCFWVLSSWKLGPMVTAHIICINKGGCMLTRILGHGYQPIYLVSRAVILLNSRYKKIQCRKMLGSLLAE